MNQGEAKYAPTKTGLIGLYKRRLGYRGRGVKAVRSGKGDEE